METFGFNYRKYKALTKSNGTFDKQENMEEPYVYMRSGPKMIIDLITKGRSVSLSSENEVSQQDSSQQTDTTTKPDVPLEAEANFGDYYVISLKESMQKSKTFPPKLYKMTGVPKLDVIDEDEIY